MNIAGICYDCDIIIENVHASPYQRQETRSSFNIILVVYLLWLQGKPELLVNKSRIL